MKINEVSNLTGFSKDTIRYYEKIGLIKSHRSANSYRYFGRKEVEDLLQTKALKEYGFTLREIKYLFRLDKTNSANCSSLTEIVDKKIYEIEQITKKLNSIKLKLLDAKKQCVGDCRSFIEKKKGDMIV